MSRNIREWGHQFTRNSAEVSFETYTVLIPGQDDEWRAKLQEAQRAARRAGHHYKTVSRSIRADHVEIQVVVVVERKLTVPCGLCEGKGYTRVPAAEPNYRSSRKHCQTCKGGGQVLKEER